MDLQDPHNSDYKNNRHEKMVKVGLATAAAPTFFRALEHNGYLMVGGGLWANNPTMNALVDALACFKVDRRQIHILSLGCGERPSIALRLGASLASVLL